MNNQKIGILTDDIASIKDNSLPTPCPYCGDSQILVYAGSQYGNESRLFLGCEGCNVLFVLDTNTGLMHKEDVYFTSLYSIIYNKVFLPNKGIVLVRFIQKKH